jgi:hypothetical protein
MTVGVGGDGQAELCNGLGAGWGRGGRYGDERDVASSPPPAVVFTAGVADCMATRMRQGEARGLGPSRRNLAERGSDKWLPDDSSLPAIRGAISVAEPPRCATSPCRECDARSRRRDGGDVPRRVRRRSVGEPDQDASESHRLAGLRLMRWAATSLSAGQVSRTTRTHRLSAAEVEHGYFRISPDLEPVSILTDDPTYRRLVDLSPLTEALVELDAALSPNAVSRSMPMTTRPGFSSRTR